MNAAAPRALTRRPVPAAALDRLLAGGVHPVLARVYAARGVESPEDLELGLDRLLPHGSLARADEAAVLLADAIAADRRLLIVGDYDADGATAAATGAAVLRRLGARVETLVPNRFGDGYGLTPKIVRTAAERRPDLLITVDNGIASLEGVEEARRLGMEVLVTDHHLPGAELPRARVIVNPNQPGCGFASKHLAGVGVMFYVLVALRAELRRRGAFAAGTEPNLAECLDLVALGTVADVVRLDRNNRILVTHGLERLRRGRARPGIVALANAAGRDPLQARTQDLGFHLGPRLNAAGRLEHMSLGIECLLAPDEATAATLAGQLDRINDERRQIQGVMEQQAREALEQARPTGASSLVMFHEAWNEGVVGLVASRLRERFHRPTVCFATGQDGELKGSGRSVDALHLRDALDLVDRRHPGMILGFGGHSAAAGLRLRRAALDTFATAFEAVASERLEPADLQATLPTDGPLAASELTLELAATLAGPAWGQGFAQPTFEGEFRVRGQTVLKDTHSRLDLVPDDAAAHGRGVTAMLWRHAEALPERIRAAYRLEVNAWNGQTRLQLHLEHWEPV